MEITINSILGGEIFKYASENNTILKTLIAAIESGADLIGADLRGADLSSVDLRGANLRGADLSSVDLSSVDLSSAKIPIFAKWLFSIEGDRLNIGCKTKTFGEWESWFNGIEEYSTSRDLEEFKRLQAMFLAHKAYYEFMKS